MKKLTKLLANRRLPGEHSIHRRNAARHAAASSTEPDITEVKCVQFTAALTSEVRYDRASILHHLRIA